MAETNRLPECHQPGSSQTHLLKEGSSASQSIFTVSSMDLHVKAKVEILGTAQVTQIDKNLMVQCIIAD